MKSQFEDGGQVVSRVKGAAPALMRQLNERAVLQELAAHHPARVTDFATALGITRAAVSDVLRQLELKGWVQQVGPVVEGRGRPAVRWERNFGDGCVAGLDIGAHAIRCLISDLAGNRLAAIEVPTTPDAPRAKRLADAHSLLQDSAAEAGIEIGDLWMTALATTGLIGPDGVVVKSIAIDDWAGVNLVEEFGAYGLKETLIVNDVRSAGLAECRVGAAAGSADVVLLHLGRRPTIMLVINGQIHEGARGISGDLSRTGLIPDERALTWFMNHQRSELADPFHAAITAVQQGDPLVTKEFTHYVGELAPLVSLVAAVIDPELIIVAGALTLLGDSMLPILTADLSQHSQNPPDVRVSKLDQFSAAQGAAIAAVDEIERRLLSPDLQRVLPLQRSSLTQ